MLTMRHKSPWPSTDLAFASCPIAPIGANIATLTLTAELDASCPVLEPSANIDNADKTAASDLDDLPPLPTSSQGEIEDLDPDYPKSRAIIQYYTLPFNGDLTQLTHSTSTTRKSVLLSLEYFYTLQKHLTSNLAILQLYPETSLAAAHDLQTRRTPTLTPLESAQNSFAIHHIGINECLRAMKHNWDCHDFGLPDYMTSTDCIRQHRNFFAHDFPTPGFGVNGAMKLGWAVKGKTEQYGNLLRLVAGNIRILEAQVGDEGIWVSPLVWEEEQTRKREEMAYGARDEGQVCRQEESSVEDHDEEEERLSTSSRAFDCLDCKTVCMSVFRFRSLRQAGWSVYEWLGEMLEGAEAVAQRRAEVYECDGGDAEAEDTKTGGYHSGYDQGYWSQIESVHVPEPDGSWASREW
jgi:hypothetical protein